MSSSGFETLNIMDIKELLEKAFAVGHTIGYGNTENHYKPEFERWWNDENTQANHTADNGNELYPVLGVVYLVQHSYEWHPITDKVFRKKEDAEYYKSIQKDADKYWDVVEFKVH